MGTAGGIPSFYLLQRIASFELTTDEIGDQATWLADGSGTFRIRSSLKLLCSTEENIAVNWKWLWKLRLPQRIKMFLWLILHSKVLTNAERFRRPMSPNAGCALCLGDVEDLEHILRNCPKAKEVWHDLHVYGVMDLAGEESFQQWLQQNLRLPRDDLEWPTKFMITVWYLWKWQCAYCLGNMEVIPRDKGLFLISKFREVISALRQDEQVSGNGGHDHIERGIRWEPLIGDWMVLNLDGAAQGNLGPAGAGGVLRGTTGEEVVGFSENLGWCSSIQAKIRAVLCGLKLAKESRVQKLWLQIDSAVVVNMLVRQSDWHPNHRSLLHQCKCLIEWEGWEVSISHCFRKVNQVADTLAKMGCEGTIGLTYYRTPPTRVWEALYADSVGVVRPRRTKS